MSGYIYRNSMKKDKTKTAEEKKVMVDKTWAGKKSKVKTLTGKRAAEIVIRPNTKMPTKNGEMIKEGRVAVIGDGRMNPPTAGHQALVERMSAIAEEVQGDAILFLSKTVGSKNPLSVSEKIDLVSEAFGDLVGVAADPFNNLIEMLQSVCEEYDSVIWVTGDDHLERYNHILETYNGKEFEFEHALAVSAGVRNPDSNLFVESISATTLREAVKSADIKTFTEGLPTKLKPKAMQIFEKVLYGLSLYDKKAKTLSETIKDQIALQRFKQ